MVREISEKPRRAQHTRTIAQLRRDQGIPKELPDYFELASQIWRTKEEVADFDRFMKTIRRRSRS